MTHRTEGHGAPRGHRAWLLACEQTKGTGTAAAMRVAVGTEQTTCELSRGAVGQQPTGPRDVTSAESARQVLQTVMSLPIPTAN